MSVICVVPIVGIGDNASVSSAARLPARLRLPAARDVSAGARPQWCPLAARRGPFAVQGTRAMSAPRSPRSGRRPAVRKSVVIGPAGFVCSKGYSGCAIYREWIGRPQPCRPLPPQWRLCPWRCAPGGWRWWSMASGRLFVHPMSGFSTGSSGSFGGGPRAASREGST